MDTHHPYLSPPDIQREFGEPIPRSEALKLSRTARSDANSLSASEVDRLRTAYDRSVRFVDEQIGRVIEYLEDRSLLDETVIVVTGDHGEEFREHGGFGHRQQLWEELIRVPLVIYHPKLPAQTVEGQAPVRLLLQSLVDGEGWFEMLESGAEYTVSETKTALRGCRGNGYKLLRPEDHEEWYRLTEQREMPIDSDDVPSNILDAMREQLPDSRRTIEGPAVDEAALEDDLSALGYLE